MAAKAPQSSRYRVRGLLLVLATLALLCLHPSARAQSAGPPFRYVRPPNCSDEMLSSNWWDEVRVALPANLYAGKTLDLHLATNLLAQESHRGNVPAEGLWGYAILTCTPTSTKHAGKPLAAAIRLLYDSATNGYLPSISRLGKLCADGSGVGRNYDEAFRWFSIGAALGDPECELQLGACYHDGTGVAPDLAKAADRYRLAAEATNYVAMKNYGSVLMDGLGVTQDVAAAKHWLLRAANEGANRRAMNNLAALYARGYPDTNSLAQTYYWLQHGAALGDALAAMQLSLFYYHGYGLIETNLDAYREWRLKAANFGATESQYEMGVACRIGDGVPVSLTESFRWYNLAAAKNHPAALYALALMYGQMPNPGIMDLKNAADFALRAARGGHRAAMLMYALECFRGAGTATDCDAGKDWLTKSAEAGWGRAEYLLFDLYYHGSTIGTACPVFPRNPVEAVHWLRRAATNDDYLSQDVLAIMLIQGTDVPTNLVEAGQWMRNAAQHGFPSAQNDLGFALMHGDLGTQDLVQSAFWCKLAAEHAADTNTYNRAQANLALVSAHLSLSQMFDLNQRLESFQPLPPAHPDPLLPGWESNPAFQQEDGTGNH